jgi:hypothetical protein
VDNLDDRFNADIVEGFWALIFLHTIAIFAGFTPPRGISTISSHEGNPINSGVPGIPGWQNNRIHLSRRRNIIIV